MSDGMVAPQHLRKPEPTLDEIRARHVVEDVDIRAIDEETRTVEFVAATENGVDTSSGKEYLRMTGARLQRYRKNPVVLDSHDRYSAGAVIGRADVKIEDRKLVASVTFAQTARAEEVWQLIKGKFLRALSVGFIPDAARIQTLDEGQTDGEGENKITGPARIIKQWELFEISVVPVPADAEALRRSFAESDIVPLASSLARIIERLEWGAEGKKAMADEKTKEMLAAAPVGEVKPPAIVPSAVQPSENELRALDIRAIAPKGMERLADELIVSGVAVDDACKRFLAELQKAVPPVGMSEPVQPEKPKTGERKLADIPDDVFVRSLVG